MSVKTVIDYVRNCLSSMDSDDVNLLADTAEATQVGVLLKDIYDELVNRQEWSWLKGPAAVASTSLVARPTELVLPTGLRHLLNLWYNVSTSGGVARRELKYVEPAEFLNRLASGEAAANKVLVTLPTQIQFYVRNDQMPTFYTSFDDRLIYTDSFDSTIDASYLATAKVSSFAVNNPVFTLTEAFTPLIPEHMVPLLQHTLNAAAHLHFKQQASPPDEVRVARQLAQARKRESKITREHYYSTGFGRR